MKKVLCVHLYNDFSGSPLVLSTAIKGMVKNGKDVTLLSSNTEGFLSDLSVDKINVPYKFHPNKLIRLCLLFLNQWAVFCQILKYRKEEVVIYVNTLLPFGAALAGKLTGKKVIYHIHETSIRPLLLKWILKFIASITAYQTIYVSKYLMEKEAIKWTKGEVIYNALSNDFVNKANQFTSQTPAKQYPFTVLMLCSLKKYKGVDQFVQLAECLPTCRFELVLNATTEEINDYFNVIDLPDNLVLFPKQSNVHWFYQRAHLVLNLSNPNEWIETFGMTLLEAMSYGIPVIGPAVGGPTEVVYNGVTGYSINVQEFDVIIKKIISLKEDQEKYQQFSSAAKSVAMKFTLKQFHNAIDQLLNKDHTISLEPVLESIA